MATNRLDFVKAIQTDERMEFHTAIARSVVRLVEAADESLRLGGSEVSLDHDDIGTQC